MTHSGTGSRRDAGVTALFLGFFAAAWFGWAQADPPGWLPAWLGTASTVGWLVAVAGAVVGFRAPRQTSALHERAARRRYAILVGTEFALAGIGAGVLGLVGQVDYIPAWVCAVVGVHFFPLAPLLRDRALIVAGVALCAVAVAGLIVGLLSATAVSTVVGIGAGVVLLAFAVTSLVRATRRDGGLA